MTDEEYVRNEWETVDFGYDAKGVLAGPWWVCVLNQRRWLYGATEAAAWAAAAVFTDERKKQIRLVEEEIWCLEEQVGEWAGCLGQPELHYYACWSRILAARKAALAELKRGMR